MSYWNHSHISRGWPGQTHIEDACPCPQEPCGMVANAAPSPDGGYDALAVIQENFVEQAGLTLGQAGGHGFAITGKANPAAE